MNEATKTPARYFAFFAAGGAQSVTLAVIAATALFAPTVVQNVTAGHVAAGTINAPTVAYRVQAPTIPSGTAFTLADRAVAYWSFDETSGTRADSKDSHDLTPSGAVSSTTGIISNAVLFDTTNTYLTGAHHADLNLSGFDWTIATMVRLDTKTVSDEILIAKWDINTPTASEFLLFWRQFADRFRIQLYDQAGATVSVTGTNAPTAGQWYSLVATYEVATGTLKLYTDAVNDGSNTLATINKTTTGMLVGDAGSGANRQLFGAVDSAFILRGRALTQEEIDWLWNDGAWRSYAALAYGPPSVAYRVVTPSISGSALFAPTVSTGSGAQSVTAGTVAAGTVNAPTLAYAVVTSSISASALFAPTVLADQAVTTGTVSGTALFAPTVILEQAVTTGTISTTVLFAPSLVLEGGVAGGHVSTTVINAPTVAYAVSTATIASGHTLAAPSVSYVVAGATRGAAVTLGAPTLAYSVTLANISGTALNAPSVAAVYSVTAGTVAAGQLFPPTVELGEPIIGLPVISATQLFPPEVAGGAPILVGLRQMVFTVAEDRTTYASSENRITYSKAEDRTTGVSG